MPWNRAMTGVADIAAALNGRRSGRGWRAHCPVHEDHTPSLHIAEGEDGRLLLKCFAGCSWGALRDALMARGLLPNKRRSVPDPEQRAEWWRERKAEELARIGAARRLWGQAVPITPDSPAGRYLSRRRLPGPWPVTLRFLPRAWHPTGRTFPVLIAAATRWPDRVPVAVQLTALTLDGQKAMVDPVRWTRGVLRGAAVQLAPWSEGMAIILTEGIEDGLSVRTVPGSTPWAVLGVSRGKDVVLPEGAEVVVALDGDEAGRRGAEAAAQAIHARGHRVRIARLPEGKDLNDLLRAETLGGVW